MKKDIKRTKNTFATMKTKIQEMEEEDSGITDLDSESASSFLQMGPKLHLMLQNNYKPEPELDQRNVILLENQSTLYFICNKRFTSEVNKLKNKLKVQGNYGTLLVNHRSKIHGYD